MKRLSEVKVVVGAGDDVLAAMRSALLHALSANALVFTVGALLAGDVSAVQRKLQPAISKLFRSSSACQYADQVNSLSELSHRLRLTCMGGGGVNARSADTRSRDVRKWHFGKVCPIESPEGQSIGLVLQLAMYARVEASGHVATMFAKARRGLISNQMLALNCFSQQAFSIAIFGSSPASARVMSFKACKPAMCAISAVDL